MLDFALFNPDISRKDLQKHTSCPGHALLSYCPRGHTSEDQKSKGAQAASMIFNALCLSIWGRWQALARLAISRIELFLKTKWMPQHLDSDCMLIFSQSHAFNAASSEARCSIFSSTWPGSRVEDSLLVNFQLNKMLIMSDLLTETE